MRTTIVLLCLAAAPLLPVQLRAQSSADPVSDALRTSTGRLARNVIAAIDDFPVTKFQYKPTPAQMSVAQIALHLADDNDFGCASLGGSKVVERPKLEPTADVSLIVARMKESFDFCRNAIQQLNDKRMGDMVPWFSPGRQATRAAMALEMQEDWADHYSQLANYMRLNGILPPTARKRGN